jgi:hypothetical protein
MDALLDISLHQYRTRGKAFIILLILLGFDQTISLGSSAIPAKRWIPQTVAPSSASSISWWKVIAA